MNVIYCKVQVRMNTQVCLSAQSRLGTLVSKMKIIFRSILRGNLKGTFWFLWKICKLDFCCGFYFFKCPQLTVQFVEVPNQKLLFPITAQATQLVIYSKWYISTNCMVIIYQCVMVLIYQKNNGFLTFLGEEN